MKIEKLSLSGKAKLDVAKDIKRRFTLDKYEQFLTKNGLFSYDPHEYNPINTLNYISETLGKVDERLFKELDNKGILSDETKALLIEEGLIFEKSKDTGKDSSPRAQISQPTSVQNTKNLSVPPKKPEIINSAQKTSLPNLVVVFFIILIALGILWRFFPNLIIFTIIVTAAIIAILSLGILALKQDGKISDNAFVNAIAEIAKMIKSFFNR